MQSARNCLCHQSKREKPDESEADTCTSHGSEAFFIENRGYNDLWRAIEGGHDVAAYLYAVLLYSCQCGMWSRH
jgi:hypothetical protein